MPADETIEFFGWQDGIDQARWLRDSGGMTLELFWSGEPLGLAAALTERRARQDLNGLVGPSPPAGIDDPSTNWPVWLVPVLRGGPSFYAQESAPGPRPGRVWLVHPPPSAGPDRTRPVFDSLADLATAAVERLGSGFYRWDAASHSMQAGSATRPWLTDRTPLEPEGSPDAAKLLERAVAAIEAQARRAGTAEIPIGLEADGLLLGAVADSLRRARRQLPSDIVARLERLPGWSWQE